MEELGAEPPLEKTGKVPDELNSYKAPVQDNIPAEDYQMYRGNSKKSYSNAFAVLERRLSPKECIWPAREGT